MRFLKNFQLKVKQFNFLIPMVEFMLPSMFTIYRTFYLFNSVHPRLIWIGFPSCGLIGAVKIVVLHKICYDDGK